MEISFDDGCVVDVVAGVGVAVAASPEMENAVRLSSSFYNFLGRKLKLA